MEGTTNTSDVVKIIYKNFESVLCGQRCHKTIKFDNQSKRLKTYVIVPVKSSSHNMGFERVQIHPEEAVGPPNKCVKFTITYFSHLENVTDNIAYDIWDSDKFVARLNVHANTVGPLIPITTYKVTFFCFRDVSETVKHVEFHNRAKCDAKFCFESDAENQLIHISQTEGIIRADSKINLKLTLNTNECGIYYKQIFCLVQFHQPIILNVVAIHNPKYRLNPKNVHFIYPSVMKFTNNYETYMKSLESNEAKEEEETAVPTCRRELDSPLLEPTTNPEESVEQNEFAYLTEHFLDMRNLTEINGATSLVNPSRSCKYYYRWNRDFRNCFRVEPRSGVLNPGDKIDFTVYFTSVPDKLFHADIDLRVFPHDKGCEAITNENIKLPRTMTLKIIGNSFPSDSCGWIAQCTILPKCLQMPACVPGETVHATFLIERRGHLPVSFVAWVPEDSNYSVQPRCGCITGGFQIFVVRFGASTQAGVYKANVKFVYNNSQSNCDSIRITTSVEMPSLAIGTSNAFGLECTFPGSKSSAVIPIENPTNLHLSYEFVTPEDVTWIELTNPKGVIEPMSECQLHAVFKPQMPCEYLDYIRCNISAVDYPKCTTDTSLCLMGSSQFGCLVATPNTFDFGECIYGVERSVKIHVYNFSPVTLNFKLYAAHRAFPIGNVERDVKINPSRGKLLGKDSVEVNITILPNGQDIFQYALVSQILETDSDDALPTENPRQIFFFRFEGVLPTFQIIDLNIEHGGPLFSPHWVWQMMSINRLNRALTSLQPEEKINLRFPEAQIYSHPITITLLMEAKKFGEVRWSFDKKVHCSCAEVTDCKFPSSKNECVHSKAMKINPTQGKLAPKSRFPLQIVLTYQSLQECLIRWTLRLPFERKIVLETTIISLPNDEPSFTSMYLHPTCQLKSIYIGDLEPPLQLFWLYNNTQQTSSYIVDKVALREATTNVRRIFDCINPNGIVPPFSSVPLKFSFKPNEITPYSAKFLLCTRESMFVTITLKGDGVVGIEQIKELSREKTIPEHPILRSRNISLNISVNLIDIPYIRVFSDANKLFSLKNTSKTDVWAFHWHSFRVEDLVVARVTPTNGIIQPGQKATMTLCVKTLCHSSFVNFSIPCDVVNYTALNAYESALKLQRKIEENANDYFVITEKGMSNDMPKIVKPDQPEPGHLFLTVNANIISSTNADQKLFLHQQMVLKSSKENIADEKYILPGQCTLMLPCIQNILEKMLWNVMNSNSFKHAIENLQRSLDYNYNQISPNDKFNSVSTLQKMACILNRNVLQELLEDILQRTLLKNGPLTTKIHPEFH